MRPQMYPFPRKILAVLMNLSVHDLSLCTTREMYKYELCNVIQTH